MRIHWLQHVPFEGLGCIQEWIDENKHQVTKTRLYDNEQIPSPETYDLLIIMGGPMNIYEEEHYPWLKLEKKAIKSAIDKGKKVLGICLGAQLIADAMDAKVIKNHTKEIGWYTLQKNNHSYFLTDFPKQFTAFHWHGDTFTLPEKTTRICHNQTCTNQAFEYDKRVLALQFHLETTKESQNQLIENCSHELTETGVIQSKKQLTDGEKNIAYANQLMKKTLEKFSE